MKVREFFRSRKSFEIIFIVAVIASFFVWLFGIFIEGEGGRQFSIFFLKCNDFFADTTNVVGYSSGRDVYHNTAYLGLQEKAYPPLTYMMMYFFSRLVNMEPYYEADYFLDMYKEPQFLIIYLIYATIGIVMIYELIRTCKNGSNKLKIFTAAAMCVSAPMIFSYGRANTIILTLFCIMFFIFYYDSDNRFMKELALIALAIATAFKMTPALLGILLLYNKQWKEAVRTVIYGIIIGIGPFFFFEGGLSNLSQMFNNMKLNVADYKSTSGATLTAAIVSFMGEGAGISDILINVLKWLTYAICLILLVAAPLYENWWERILAVSMVLITAPSHSGHYCIIYVIPAVVAFLNAEQHRLTDWIVEIAFLLIMCDIQSDIGDRFLNYHLAIIIILCVLVVRAFIQIGKRFNRKNVSKDVAEYNKQRLF